MESCGHTRCAARARTRPQGVQFSDTLYNKVIKDLCISKNQAWQLKPGADAG